MKLLWWRKDPPPPAPVDDWVIHGLILEAIGFIYYPDHKMMPGAFTYWLDEYKRARGLSDDAMSQIVESALRGIREVKMADTGVTFTPAWMVPLPPRFTYWQVTP